MTEVLLETDGDIAVLTLNRPDKRNALTDTAACSGNECHPPTEIKECRGI